MRLALRTTTAAFAMLAALTLATPSGVSAQDPEDPCAALLDPLNQQITENWDDLSTLTFVLNNWTTTIQVGFSFYEPDALETMSTGSIERLKGDLVSLRDCLPGIARAFDRLKKRIEELQNAPGVVGSEDRLRQQRLAKFRELERVHAEVAAALDRILG